MADTDSIVVETASRIFADLADSQAILHAGGTDWKTPLWTALTEAGLTRAWLPEELGGADVPMPEVFGVVEASGRAALAAPLAETLMAGWLLAQAGLALPEGVATIAPVRSSETITVDRDGRLHGRCRRVPYAGESSHIALTAGAAPAVQIALVDTAACRITPGQNLAGDACDGVEFDGVTPHAIAAAHAGFDPRRLQCLGAILRSLQIAGALETALRITVDYANQRVAFERPIGKFQAIQHSLARLAGEVAAAVSAANSAADAFASGAVGDALLLETAAAKIRAGEAAETGAAIAHQVHGAIGFTSEHVLHRYTLHALAWRDDFGSESAWAVELGRRVAGIGADELWPLVAAR